jgi:putative transposase
VNSGDQGKTRHILVDTLGLLAHAVVDPPMFAIAMAAFSSWRPCLRRFPFFEKTLLVSGYQGPKFETALAKALLHLHLEIVKRSDAATGFKIVPKRGVVEPSIAWLNRCRRLAKDWENLNRKAIAFLRLALPFASC